MKNPEYETNYITRGECLSGSTKEQKRAIRRKMDSRKGGSAIDQKFIAQDRILYYVDERPNGLGIRNRRVVRANEKETVIQDCHENEIGGGHFKRDKTLGKIAERFSWQGLVNDVKQYVLSCDEFKVVPSGQ